MGNSTSTSTSAQTDLERFTEATKYITIPLLQQRLRCIDPVEVQAQLDDFKEQIPFIPSCWISLLEQQHRITDWSAYQTVVDQCVDDVSGNQAAYQSIEILLVQITDRIHKNDLPIAPGIIALVHLAAGIAENPGCWKIKDPTHPEGSKRLHRMTADAIQAYDMKDLISGADETIIQNTSKGSILYYGAFGLYRGFDVLRRPQYESWSDEYSTDSSLESRNVSDESSEDNSHLFWGGRNKGRVDRNGIYY
jgi:hypothetical protein